MFGERLKNLREAKRLSQVDIATKIGVSKQTVCNWENGNAMPAVDTVLRLADYFSVTTDYLLARSDDTYLNIEDLTLDQLAHVQELIKYLQELNKK